MTEPSVSPFIPHWRAKGPPSRLCADRDHPWHDPLWVPYAVVYLDGQPVNRCRSYDVEAGWVEVYCHPYRREGDGLAMERRYGVVTVQDRAAMMEGGDAG